MTRKEMRKRVNEVVENELNKFENEVAQTGTQFIARLRTCNAEVLASDHYYILRSYRTIVAIIDSDGLCYDFLRKVYGYTSTSAQHINKFMKDYGNGYGYCWREV